MTELQAQDLRPGPGRSGTVDKEALVQAALDEIAHN